MKGTQARKLVRECAYCGAAAGATNDHVVPASFFDPGDLCERLTVPSCEDCNVGFRDAEEYMRVVLTCNIKTGAHPAARKVFDRKVVRSIAKHRWLNRKVFSSIRPIRLRTSGGIELPVTYHGFETDYGLMDQFISKLIHGLFYCHNSRRLKDGFTVQYAFDRDPNELGQEMIRLGQQTPLHVIGDVLIYKFLSIEEDPDVSLWALQFFGGMNIVAFTVDPSDPRIAMFEEADERMGEPRSLRTAHRTTRQK